MENKNTTKNPHWGKAGNLWGKCGKNPQSTASSGSKITDFPISPAGPGSCRKLSIPIINGKIINYHQGDNKLSTG